MIMVELKVICSKSMCVSFVRMLKYECDRCAAIWVKLVWFCIIAKNDGIEKFFLQCCVRLLMNVDNSKQILDY